MSTTLHATDDAHRSSSHRKVTPSHEIETIGAVSVLRLHDPTMMDSDRIAETAAVIDAFLRDCTTEFLLINFGQIRFCHSLALGMIAPLRKKAACRGRFLSICDLHPAALWAIRATRLHTLLDIFYDEELALSLLQ